MKKNGFTVLLWVVILISGGVMNANASGYAIVEQGVRGLGTAYAGAAALAQDPSIIFYNPAGLVRLAGKQVEAGLHYIVPKAEFKNNGSATVLTTPLTGGDGGDGGEAAFVPNFYYSHQVSDGVVAGIGIHAPFGLATEYDKDWVGRYHAVESRLATININPSMAARMNEKWSVGAGLSIEYAKATLSSKADLGTIRNLPPFNQDPYNSLLPAGTPQGDDGFSEIEGDNWAYGFNIGLLFEPTQGTRFGLAFRSSIHHKLDGEVDWEYDTTTAQAIGTAINGVDGNANATLNLPETLSLAGYNEFNDKLAIVADVTFTNWDRFDELRIKYGSGQQDTVVTTEWDDTWRFGLGFIYTPTENCTGRIGCAYDQSPVPSEEYRTPRIPDADRIWIALGAGYKVNRNFEFNLGYTHIFVDDPAVNKPATGEDAIRGNLVGQWDVSVDIVSLNATYIF
jgi:long-chain fatty acid transport protein